MDDTIEDRQKLLTGARLRVLSGLPITYPKAVVIMFLLPSTWMVVDVYNRGVVISSSSRYSIVPSNRSVTFVLGCFSSQSQEEVIIRSYPSWPPRHRSNGPFKAPEVSML